MYILKRTFPDIDSISDEKLPYSKELAEVLYFFYWDNTNKDFIINKEFCCLNDLINVVAKLVELSQKSLGEVQVEQALREMYDNRSSVDHTYVSIDEDNLMIGNLRHEVKAVLLWSCELYCRIRLKFGDDKTIWENSVAIFHGFWEVMIKNDRRFLNGLPSMGKAIDLIKVYISKRGEVPLSETEILRNELNQKDELIKELKEQIATLSAEIPNIVVTGKQQRAKLAHELLKELKVDMNFPKATQWAKIMSAMTNAATRTCQNIISGTVDVDMSKLKNKEDIEEAFSKLGYSVSF